MAPFDRQTDRQIDRRDATLNVASWECRIVIYDIVIKTAFHDARKKA